METTPSTYAADEAARIREMVVQPHSQLLCPRCGGDIIIGAVAIRNPNRSVTCSVRTAIGV